MLENDLRIARRGYYKEDERWFSKDEIKRLKIAQEEVQWLLDRNYNSESVINFVGGRYQFSARQRDAIKRSTSNTLSCVERKKKRLEIGSLFEDIIYVDGFNIIITLEVALSEGTLIYGNDETIRDLAGLRGTYRLIDKTDIAIDLIGKTLDKYNVPRCKLYFDAPVSNSGRLKQRIFDASQKWNCEIDIELVPNADPILEKLERVVSTDSVILDKCKSWFNLTALIIEENIKNVNIVSLF